MKSIGVELIATERERQVSEEGWTAEHDAVHDTGELADAAACYALRGRLRSRFERGGFTFLEFIWPWDPTWFKPTPENRVKELVKAGALIAAEIDRLSAKSKEGA